MGVWILTGHYIMAASIMDDTVLRLFELVGFQRNLFFPVLSIMGSINLSLESIAALAMHTFRCSGKIFEYVILVPLNELQGISISRFILVGLKFETVWYSEVCLATFAQHRG